MITISQLISQLSKYPENSIVKLYGVGLTLLEDITLDLTFDDLTVDSKDNIVYINFDIHQTHNFKS